jgi:hypothetical protein
VKEAEKNLREEFDRKVNEEKQRSEAVISTYVSNEVFFFSFIFFFLWLILSLSLLFHRLTRTQEEMKRLQKAYDVSQSELLEYKNKDCKVV